MNTEQIKAIQLECGTTPDGFWGPVSIRACKGYILSLMPSTPFPHDNSRELRAFYGEPGDESQLITVDPGIPLFYENRLVTKITFHHKLIDYLLPALKEAHSVCPAVVEIYDGIFNNRPKRGGSTPSLHAFGAAIDLDAARNGNQQHWPTSASMSFPVIKAFARHGFTSAAVFWGRDAMHFQGTQP